MKLTKNQSETLAELSNLPKLDLITVNDYLTIKPDEGSRTETTIRAFFVIEAEKCDCCGRMVDKSFSAELDWSNDKFRQGRVRGHVRFTSRPRMMAYLHERLDGLK